VDGGSSTRFHQVNLGVNHALSKRTLLYGVAILQKAAGAGPGVDLATGATVNYAQIPDLPNSGSDRQLSSRLGFATTSDSSLRRCQPCKRPAFSGFSACEAPSVRHQSGECSQTHLIYLTNVAGFFTL